MAVALPTVEDFIIKRGKEFGFWIVFHTRYNDICAFKKEIVCDNPFDNTNEKYIDTKAREKFLNFMKENFPNTKLTEVFDLVSPGMLVYPYLGSIGVDCDEGDEVFNALSKMYGNPFEDAITNNAVFWVMRLEDAIRSDKERKEFIEAEFGD
ncbi:hypothetical protein [Campylobacter sp. RM16190]|uniref:hypothetical protein n=1 Tax=Campylobacter sp. RM16190 TaxID=1705727 RepID=UPI001472AA9C|nr:hypothetical protein [Campylobacter sp. RM16190]